MSLTRVSLCMLHKLLDQAIRQVTMTAAHSNHATSQTSLTCHLPNTPFIQAYQDIQLTSRLELVSNRAGLMISMTSSLWEPAYARPSLQGCVAQLVN